MIFAGGRDAGRGRLVLLVAAAILLASCGRGESPASAQAARLDAARSRWAAAGVDDYTWRFARECFCPQVSAEVRVADGAAADVSRLTDPRWPGEVPELEFTTMDELFDLIERELGESDEVTAMYDPETGQVRRVDFDRMADAVDDERAYEVTSFVPTEEVPEALTLVELAVRTSSPSAGVVRVEGSATVPDGAQVNWALNPLPEPDGCPVDVASEADPCDAPYGSATVVDGRFGFRVDGLDPGDVELFVAFDPLNADQPVAVVERYGWRGRRMTGPQVVDQGGGAYRAQLIQTVTIG